MYKLYGISNCTYCQASKKLLNEMDIEYDYIQIDRNVKTQFLDSMKEKTNNQRTFPLIFHNDIFIGGFKQLNEYLAFQ